MLVEALFWFHPLVWWLGGRLVVERERACDEAVIQSGRDRHAYAEGILRICQHYVEPPLCSAGVSGGTLRKRIEEIMTTRALGTLSLAKKSLLAIAALLVFAGPLAAGLGSSEQTTEMKHYRSAEWGFEIDVPKSWIVMPPVSGNSQAEVIRFTSRENGTHGLIVFRNPIDPSQSPDRIVAATQEILAKGGFSNFVTGETTIGSRKVMTLDFSRPTPDGTGMLYCRHYFIIDGPLAFVLGFGTSNRDEKFELYEKMAKSFEFEAA